MSETRFRTLRDVPTNDYVYPGSPLCAGCGPQLLVREFLKVLGDDTIVVTVPSCMGLLTLYPYAAIRQPGLFAPFGAGPAAVQGLVDALEILKGERRPKVLLITGDGAAYDIGLQATSSTIHKGLDFYYLVYDNEAYGNTGFQFSSATPFAAKTSTTPPTTQSQGNTLRKKDLFAIWAAHRPAYLSTVAVSKTVDLWRKVEKSMELRGPKLFIGLGVCPTGWWSDPKETVKLDALAVDTGMWPLKEYVDGEVRHTYIPKARKPVEEYLSRQRRFEHLFKPVKRDDIIAEIQRDVDRYWEKVLSSESPR